ncbi:RNA polymerase-associated protein rtf1 [Rhodotorula kratochvilovae]
MDFEEELLGLAGGTSKRKSTKSSKSNKRKRAADSDDGSASDMDMSQSDSDAPPASSRARRVGGPKSAALVESDDDEDEDNGVQPTEENPYPVEGIYKTTAERNHVAGMSELERENFIGERMDAINEARTRLEVAKLARESTARGGGQAEDDDEDDDEDEARGTRSRKTTGSSKTKAEGLEKLKKSRAEKGKKKEKADDSDDEYEEPGRRSRRKASPTSSASSDMEVSDGEDNDRATKKKSKKAGPEPLGPSELREINVPRTKLGEMCRAPWFEEWIKGAFVRVTIGPDPNDPARGNLYRLAVVTGLKKAKQPYRVEGNLCEHELVVTHGKDKGTFPITSVSNSEASDREYARYVQICKSQDVAPCTSKDAAKVKAQLAKHSGYTLTEEDLAKQLQASGATMRGPGARTRLKLQRDHAIAAGDEAKVKDLNEQLARFDAPVQDQDDRARKINERNRANNRDEIRRAEAKSQEQRRKQNELLARGDTDVKIDPSARVKTMPRLNYDSRQQTPAPGSGTATPSKAPVVAAAAAGAENGAPRARGSKIELASQVEVNVDDLLDF